MIIFSASRNLEFSLVLAVALLEKGTKVCYCIVVSHIRTTTEEHTY